MTSIMVDQNKDYNAIRRLSIRAGNPFERGLVRHRKDFTFSIRA